MQPQLTTKDGNVIPLTDDIYESILRLMGSSSEPVEPAGNIEELEEEFAELFADSASTNELLAEHVSEKTREEQKLERFN